MQKDRLKSLIPVGNQSFNILLHLIWGPHCLRYVTTNTEKNTAGKSACGQLALAYLVMMMTQQIRQWWWCWWYIYGGGGRGCSEVNYKHWSFSRVRLPCPACPGETIPPLGAGWLWWYVLRLFIAHSCFAHLCPHFFSRTSKKMTSKLHLGTGTRKGGKTNFAFSWQTNPNSSKGPSSWLFSDQTENKGQIRHVGRLCGNGNGVKYKYKYK